jgi:hypothetical protein
VRGRLARALTALCATGLVMALFPAARAQEQGPADWRVEFEAVCVKTDLALTLPSEELAELVARCDRLAERIGAEGEVVRKVFLRRLQSCRSLFVFVLESRGAAPSGGSVPAQQSATDPALQSPPAPQPQPGAEAPSPQNPPAPEGRPVP